MPIRWDITLHEEADFHAWATMTDADGNAVDLTGYTFEAQIADSLAGTPWTNCATPGFVNVESRAAGAMRIWGGVDGVLHVYIEEATVNGVAANNRGFWTLNSYDGTDVVRIAEGRVFMSRSAI